MLQMFLLYIIVTVHGEVYEFRHPKLFQDIEACSVVMTQMQQMLHEKSIFDAGCRSVSVDKDGTVKE